jgi:hypothetical protein
LWETEISSSSRNSSAVVSLFWTPHHGLFFLCIVGLFRAVYTQLTKKTIMLRLLKPKLNTETEEMIRKRFTFVCPCWLEGKKKFLGVCVCMYTQCKENISLFILGVELSLKSIWDWLGMLLSHRVCA